jgi:hypothetical protein
MSTPAPHEVTILSLKVRQTDDGRLEGQACLADTTVWREFSGVLELLKVIEELLSKEDPAPPTLTNPKESEQ